MIHHCYGCPCCSCPYCGRPYRPQPWAPRPVWGGGPMAVQAKFRPDAALAQARAAVGAR